jgi:hypothetical protein
MTRLTFRVAVIFFALLFVGGCAHYRTTLTDDQGRTVTCEASGKNGIFTGYMLRSTFQECVENAKANGYREGSTRRVSKPSAPAPGLDVPASSSSSSPADLQTKLLALKQVYEQGLITKQEYEAKKKSLIEGF